MFHPARTILLSLIAAAMFLAGCAATSESRARQRIEKGDDYFRQRRFVKAIVEYKVASQNTPDDPEPLFKLAMSYLNNKDWRNGVRNLEKVLKLDPDHVGALFTLSSLALDANNPASLENASSMLSRITSKNPGVFAAWYELAAVQLKQDKREEALRTFDRALSLSVEEPDLIGKSVQAAIDRKELDLARELVTRAIVRMPRVADVAALSGSLAEKEGRPELARSETARALAINPDSPAALRLRMSQAEADGHPEQSEDAARRLAAVPGRENRALYASLLAEHGKTQECVRVFRELRKKFPDDLTLQVMEIKALLLLHLARESREALDAAIAEDEKRADLFLLRARLNIDERRIDEARADIGKLDELRAHSEAVYLEKARLYALCGEKTEQADALAEALSRNPRNLAARLELASLLTGEGKAGLAFATLDRATDQEKTTSGFIVARNAVLMTKGEWAAARRSVEDGLQRFAGTTGLLLQRASLRIHDGDPAGAQSILEPILSNEVGNQAALDLMAELFEGRNQPDGYTHWLEQYAASHPGDPETQFYAARVLRRKGNYKAARIMLARASASGKTREADIEIAAIDIQEHRLEAARVQLETALRMRDDPAVRMLLAELFSLRADWGGAEQQLRAAIRISPGTLRFRAALALVIAKDPQRIDEAFALATSLVSRNPNDPLAQGAAGWLCYQKRRYREAADYLRAAAKTADDATTHFRLAAACQKIGDTRCANLAMEVASRKNPREEERAEFAQLLRNARLIPGTAR